MEKMSNLGSPLRASTPITGEDDGIFLEDTLPLERSFEEYEDEELTQETNLEISWRKEAEMLESRARGAL